MYEMLTGKVPFDADTPVSVALKHMQEEPRPAKEVNPNIPLAVNDVIMKALKKDVTLRYQSATEMLIDLRRALKEPSGDFVDNKEYTGDFPTQRISTIGMEEENARLSSKNTAKKQNKFVQFVKKHKALSIIIGLILLFVISISATIGITNATMPKEVQIPNLVGMTADEAKALLDKEKIKYVEESQEYNTEYEAGKIISQNPPYVENRKIKQNTEMKVVISLGTETTKVPKLKGLTKQEAEEAAKEAKIKLEYEEEISKTVEAGVIIKQDTDEGKEVNAGDTVKVYVSIGTGIKQVVVSSVMYKDEESAKQILTGLGLSVDVEYGEDKTRGNGVVLKQSIDSGKTVDEGTKITITVNKLAETKTGTVTINVKSLKGYTESKTTDEDGKETTTKPKDVELVVKVDDEQVEKVTVKENTVSKNVSVSGKGTITIKVYIDGSLKKTVDMNLDNTKSLTIE